MFATTAGSRIPQSSRVARVGQQIKYTAYSFPGVLRWIWVGGYNEFEIPQLVFRGLEGWGWYGGPTPL